MRMRNSLLRFLIIKNDTLSVRRVKSCPVRREIKESGVCPISNSEAMQAFEKGLAWLRHQEEATSVNTATLLHLRELAEQKRERSGKQSNIF